jgi:hypothetical protein
MATGNSARRRTKTKTQELKSAVPWLALSVLLLILLGVSAAVAIRSNIFNFGMGISEGEYRALLVFIASGLGTAATAVGLLFTRSHNQETSARLTLDTVVKSLELLATGEGTYAPRAKIAGALATLVQLEQPVIAMRTLSAAWDEKKVDPATACWLVSEVFKTGSTESKLEASGLLLRHARELTGDKDGEYEWPGALQGKWPNDIPLDARGTNLYALLHVLISRHPHWWRNDLDWSIITLYIVRRHDDELSLRNFATMALKEVVRAWQQGDVTWPIEDEMIRLETIRQEISRAPADDTVLSQSQATYIGELRKWLRKPEASRQEVPSTPPQPKPKPKPKRPSGRPPPSPAGS